MLEISEKEKLVMGVMNFYESPIKNQVYNKCQ